MSGELNGHGALRINGKIDGKAQNVSVAWDLAELVGKIRDMMLGIPRVAGALTAGQQLLRLLVGLRVLAFVVMWLPRL